MKKIGLKTVGRRALRQKRTRKYALFFCILLLFFLFPSGKIAKAEGSKDGENALYGSIVEQIEKLDLEELERYIDSLDAFSDESIAERIVEYIKGKSLDYDGFFKGLLSVVFENVVGMLPAFSCVAAISLLCAVLSALKSHYVGSSTAEIIFLVSFAAALIPVLSILTECFLEARESVGEMRKQMELLFPILLTLMSASGGSVSAAIYQPAVAFLCTTIVQTVSSVVFPITLTVIAFSVASHLSPDLKIKRFAAFFKSINKWVIGVSVSVFGMFFTVQGLTSATYDGVAKRAAKYAIGTGVPIVGGFLSGGFDLVLAGSILIKNSLGVFGIFMLFAVLAEPLLTLIAANLSLRLTAAIAEPLGDSRISDFLGETAKHLNYLSAGLLFVGFLYLVLIVLMICSAEVIL